MLVTVFPEWTRGKLEKTAGDRALEIEIERGTSFVEPRDTDRLVVNMLRHEFTNYDEDQTQEAHRHACQAIKVRFPWLGAECERQIERRAKTEREGAEFLEALAHWKQMEAERRKERSRSSLEVIKSIKVGDEVNAMIGRWDRVGTVTWRGRLRVEVAYVTKGGNARSKRLYASDVRPAKVS